MNIRDWQLKLGSSKAYRQVMSVLSYVARFSIVLVWVIAQKQVSPLFYLALGLFETGYFLLNHRRFSSNMHIFYAAIIPMILCSGVLKYYLSFVGSIFAFLSLSCMTVHNIQSSKIWLQLFQLSAYLLPYAQLMKGQTFTAELALAMIFDLFIYLQSLMLMFSARELWFKKVEIRSLNELLQERNMELVEYMHDAQEMSKLNERAEIAQNLHDSLGHVFMAMNMNIGVAQELVKKDPDKTSQLLDVIGGINQMGIQELSKTVATLKAAAPAQFSLRKSIEDALFESLYLSEIDIRFEMDDQVEFASPYVKNTIYAVVRENYTNTLKHADATAIDIHITLQEQVIQVSYRDNGVGCGGIRKSHGLKGIEARLAAVGGHAVFGSSAGCGFSCCATIPFASK